MKKILTIFLTISISFNQMIFGNPGNTRGNLFTWIADYLNIPQPVQENIFSFIYISLIVGFAIYTIYIKYIGGKEDNP